MRRFLAGLMGLALVTTSAFGVGTAASDNAGQTPVSATEVQELRELMHAQAKQLEEQRLVIEQEQRRLKELEERVGTATAVPKAAPASEGTTPINGSAAFVTRTEKPPEYAPLSVKIGAASFTPGGFLDFGSVFRSTNVGSGGATSFGSIPFNNTPQGNLSETRFSSQTSRLSLKVDSDLAGNKVLGYFESDFTGNQPASQYVTSNSNTFRLRMFMVDVRRDKWEMLGGQAWTMMTPARRGLGMMPADLFIPQVADANYQVGLVWARQAQFRVMYHPSDHWVLGVSVENPEQFVGVGSSVVLPSALSSVLASQVDGGANTATPNNRPDVIAKVAHDGQLGTHTWHLEASGVVRGFKALVPAAAGYEQHATTGTGASINTIFGATKHLNLVATTFWSDGGGRYTAALGPDMIVLPDGAPSLVHAGAGLVGLEWQASKSTSLAGYYGGTYYQRAAFMDTTGHLGGFGFVGSSNAANRTVQEATLSVTRTFWKNPNFGALQLITQMSYLTRSPWYVAPGAPKNARSAMGFAVLHYVLP